MPGTGLLYWRMAKPKTAASSPGRTIALNKKARHDYFL